MIVLFSIPTPARSIDFLFLNGGYHRRSRSICRRSRFVGRPCPGNRSGGGTTNGRSSRGGGGGDRSSYKSRASVAGPRRSASARTLSSFSPLGCVNVTMSFTRTSLWGLAVWPFTSTFHHRTLPPPRCGSYRSASPHSQRSRRTASVAVRCSGISLFFLTPGNGFPLPARERKYAFSPNASSTALMPLS